MTHSLKAKLGIYLERKKNVDRKSVREFSFCLVICRTHHAKDAQYMLHVVLQALHVGIEALAAGGHALQYLVDKHFGEF